MRQKVLKQLYKFDKIKIFVNFSAVIFILRAFYVIFIFRNFYYVNKSHPHPNHGHLFCNSAQSALDIVNALW